MLLREGIMTRERTYHSMSSWAEVEVESPLVLPRMKSKQMLPRERQSTDKRLLESIGIQNIPLKGVLLVRVHWSVSVVSVILIECRATQK